MTPKEKASALIQKFYTFGINKEGQSFSWFESKQLAILCVDEILNIKSVDKDYDLSTYWEEVKQEIEKL